MKAVLQLPNFEKALKDINDTANNKYLIRTAQKFHIPSDVLTKEIYLKFITQFGNYSIAGQGGTHSFKIDANNEEIITQLYYYITGDDKFKGDLEKGLLLAGYYGSGKTVLLNALRLTVNYFITWFQKTKSEFFRKEWEAEFKVIQDSPVRFYKSIDIVKTVIELKGEVPESLKRTYEVLFIDELGYEPNVSNIFGTPFMPIVDLLRERYDKGLITWGSTNLNIEDLGKHYGALAQSRIKAMFNVIEVTGIDRRNNLK
jgi:DNA replication protein DnaC